MGTDAHERPVLVTGGAGFIGGHLARELSKARPVRVIDNLSTGRRENLPPNMEFFEGDVGDARLLRRALDGVEVVFHVAALPSVSRSVDDPLLSHEANATGTLQVLDAMRKSGASRIVYAASSSAYGDAPTLPKREDMPARPLSPYAIAKHTGELYVSVFHNLYGLEGFSLRYFNVYGPRQDPESPYAAVVPRFLKAAASGSPLTVFGDGFQTRDFTFVEDVVRANLLAAKAPHADGDVLNIAGGRRISVMDLIQMVGRVTNTTPRVIHEPARAGDVRDSLADLSRAKKRIGYEPQVPLEEGLRRTWEQLAATVRGR